MCVYQAWYISMSDFPTCKVCLIISLHKILSLDALCPILWLTEGTILLKKCSDYPPLPDLDLSGGLQCPWVKSDSCHTVKGKESKSSFIKSHVWALLAGKQLQLNSELVKGVCISGKEEKKRHGSLRYDAHNGRLKRVAFFIYAEIITSLCTTSSCFIFISWLKEWLQK